MLSGAFVPCCRDICLLNHPSPELQGGSQCHPILPSLPYPTACGLWPKASAPPGPGQPSPSAGAWLALSVEWVGVGGTGRPRVCACVCTCTPAQAHASVCRDEVWWNLMMPLFVECAAGLGPEPPRPPPPTPGCEASVDCYTAKSLSAHSWAHFLQLELPRLGVG